MASDTKQRQAAKAFVKDWLGKGYEKGETARFWMDLLGRVYGITNPAQFIQFELPVKTPPNPTSWQGSSRCTRNSHRRRSNNISFNVISVHCVEDL